MITESLKHPTLRFVSTGFWVRLLLFLVTITFESIGCWNTIRKFTMFRTDFRNLMLCPAPNDHVMFMKSAWLGKDSPHLEMSHTITKLRR